MGDFGIQRNPNLAAAGAKGRLLRGLRKDQRKPTNTKDVRIQAKRLVEDPEYRRELRRRLREGTAGPMESLLWLYAYGKPKEAIDEAERERKLIAAREAAIAAIRSLPSLRQPERLPAGEVIDADTVEAERSA